MPENKFKPNDHVRIKIDDIYYYGEITIVRDDGYCKVLFYGDGPDYWYYPESSLELMEEKDVTD